MRYLELSRFRKDCYAPNFKGQKTFIKIEGDIFIESGPQPRRSISAPSQNPLLVAGNYRTKDPIFVFEGLDHESVMTYGPQPRRPIIAPSQNPAIVAVKHRAIDLSLRV